MVTNALGTGYEVSGDTAAASRAFAQARLGRDEAVGDVDPDKLNIPGLNGAYHRQCVGCHVEYESDIIGCTDCHELRDQEAAKK